MKTKKASVFGFLMGVIACIAIGIGFIYITGSDKLKASFSVMKENSENSIVDIAGKSKVAEQLAITRIENLRNKLIKMKSLRRSITRYIEDENTSQERKENYQELISKIDIAEKNAEETYKKSASDLEELRTKLSIIDTEIAIAKTTSQALSINITNSPIKNDIDKIIESLNKDLDTANAELDVVILESNF